MHIYVRVKATQSKYLHFNIILNNNVVYLRFPDLLFSVVVIDRFWDILKLNFYSFANVTHFKHTSLSVLF